jgi:hypothetical protein
VTSPINGTNYYWQAIPGASFSCTPGTEGALASCMVSADGRLIYEQQSAGGALEAGSVSLPDSIGMHTVTVTATESDGQAATQTVTYTSSLIVLPSVSVDSPLSNARYTLGQVVKASYSCLPATKGPLVTGCVGPVANGKPIDTGSLGKRTFTATATDATGQSTSLSVPYVVVPTTNHFTIRHVAASSRGLISLALNLPGPGKIGAVATGVRGGSHAARTTRFVYARVSAAATRAGARTITMKPDGQARALISTVGATRLVSVAITYTPTGGKPHELRSKVVRIR